MGRDEFLQFSPPTIGDEEFDEVSKALRSGWLSVGPRTGEFERSFRDWIDAPEALALNSCTSALHLALVANEVGGEDEVITTPMTFAATVNVIEHVGARPVLVDVDPETLNLAPDAVAEAVTPRTRAVIAVHYGGHPVELDPLRDLCDARDLLLVEDAAHALPARYRGRRIGAGPNPAAFSFYATKNLTTGEGGMLTGSPEFIERARLLSLHGMSRDAWKRYEETGSWYYEIVDAGFKYNMSDIQAAMGLRQLEKLADFHARRKEIAAAYNAAFGSSEVLQTPVERDHVESAWHLYVVRLRLENLRIDRGEFIDLMSERQIGTSVHFIPIHVHPYYRERYEYNPEDFPVAFDAYRRMFSIPLHPKLSERDVDDVITAVLEIVEEYRA